MRVLVRALYKSAVSTSFGLVSFLCLSVATVALPVIAVATAIRMIGLRIINMRNRNA